MTIFIVLIASIILLWYIIDKYGETPTYTDEEQKERECTCSKAHSYDCKCEKEDNILTKGRGYIADKNKDEELGDL